MPWDFLVHRKWRLAVVLAGIVAAGGLLIWFLRPQPPPNFDMIVRGYSQPRGMFTNDAVKRVEADVQFESHPIGWFIVTGKTVVRTNFSAESLTEMSDGVAVDELNRAAIALPEGTLRWQVRLVAFNPNFAEQARMRLFGRFRMRGRRLFETVLSWLPHREDEKDVISLESDPIEVAGATNGLPRTYHLHRIDALGP